MNFVTWVCNIPNNASWPFIKELEKFTAVACDCIPFEGSLEFIGIVLKC